MVLFVERRRELIPCQHDLAVIAELRVSLGQHITVDAVKQFRHALHQRVDRQRRLGTRITTHGDGRLVLIVLRADLDTQRHTTQFPVIELEARVVVVTQIRMRANTSAT